MRAVERERERPRAAEAAALHERALTALSAGDLRTARRLVEDGLALSAPASLAGEWSALQALSALLWFHAEQPARAFAELAGALGELPAEAPSAREAAARLYGQRAYLSFRLGSYDEGLSDSDSALFALQAGRDEIEAADSIEARLRSNRGLAEMYAGHYAEARADLERALELHRKAGERLKAAEVLDNLGCLATLLADYPAALRSFDEALAEHRRLGVPSEHVVVDRAELFMTARLYPEARAALAEAVELLEEGGLATDGAEARLLLAEASLLDGDAGAARTAAEEARSAFERQERAAWAVRAEEVLARIERDVRAARSDVLAVCESARRSAVMLEAAGWHLEALEARVAAARAARRAERSDLVLDVVGAFTAPGAGLAATAPPLERAFFAHARALGLEAMGRRRDALTVLEEGMRAALEPAEWQHAGGRRPHGLVAEEMRETGFGLVAATGDPDRVLAFARRATLERSEGEAAEAGDERLLFFFVHGGALSVVVGEGEERRLVRLGPAEEVARATASLRFAMSELAQPGRRRLSADAPGLLRRSLAELEELLELGDLVARISPLRIVSAGPLSDLPWAALPSLARREFVLTPGVGTGRPIGAPARERILVVAGPNLAGAALEAAEVAVAYEGREVSVLSSGAATVAALLSGLGRCDVAHLALHGRFRADNPAMSSLVLSDGEVTMHELSRLGTRPSCIVFSACDAGRTEGAGDGNTGAAASLLAAGGGADRHVIAPLVPVSDRAMPQVAAALHRRLARGDEPQTALARVRQCSPTLSEVIEDAGRTAEAEVAVALASLVVHRGAPPPGSTFSPGEEFPL